MDTQDESSDGSSESESSDVREESSRGKGDGSGWFANTVMGTDNSCPSESGESHADDSK